MKNKKIVFILVLMIAILSIIASSVGIFYDGQGESYEYETIRGQTIEIYGKGLYKHMSADVAVQGIAQDYVTLFIGVPILLISMFLAYRGSIKARFILAGSLLYFLVTYLFYLTMGMYNFLFLVYASLLGLTFFALFITLMSFEIDKVFSDNNIFKYSGIFLIINSILIGFLWLSVVIPPLLDGTIYPVELNHYTTLIVQGFDLGLLLPIAFVIGLLSIRKNKYGYFFSTVYLIFLSFLMTALTSKTIFMNMQGQNVIPVIFIMPTIAIISMFFSYKNLKTI